MRYASFAILIASGTCLSGCASDQLAAIANLGTSCTSGAQSLNCSGPTTTGTTGSGSGTVAPPPPNSGNNNAAATGDRTLAIESGVLKSTSTTKAVSTFSSTTNPNTASIAITTNLPTNSNWPQTHIMPEFLYGTCWTQGGIDPANKSQCLTPNTANSLGANYHEYRFRDTSIPADEELQVWNWNNSYGIHYRDNASGDVASHEAYSFGGNYTTAANIPTSGSAQYKGKFTGTAASSGWIDNGLGQDISHNNHWQVTGDTNVTANFGTGAFTGTLAPKSWVGLVSDGSLQDAMTHDPNKFILVGGVLTPNPNYIGYNVNVAGFMLDNIDLNGTITTSSTDLLHPNSVTGTSALDSSQGWLNDANSPLYAGFFGSSATEVTGAFAVNGTYVGPVGGNSAHAYYREGHLSMQGIFNGKCVSGTNIPGLVCP